MPDQANRLRELMHARAAALRPSAAGAPRLVAVAGGKGGVGTTTLAVNLSIALVREGRRTLLVDADPARADIAAHCNMPEAEGLSDVLAGRHTLHEAIFRSSFGVQVLAGRPAGTTEWTARAAESMLHNLQDMAPHCDVVLLDVGASIGSVARHWWRAADLVVLVTTPDNVAVMDAYAAVKTHLDTAEDARIVTMMNFVEDESHASEMHDRLAIACRRFLGTDLRSLGSIPNDVHFRAAAAAEQPVVLHAPHCAAAEQVMRAAACLPLGEPRGAIAGLQMSTK